MAVEHLPHTAKFPSLFVPDLHILLISQIRECVDQILRIVFRRCACRKSVSCGVSATIDDVKHCEKADVETERRERNRDTCRVDGRFRLQKRLRRDDICYAVRGEEERARDRLLRVAGDVAGQQGVHEACGSGDHGDDEDGEEMQAFGAGIDGAGV